MPRMVRNTPSPGGGPKLRLHSGDQRRNTGGQPPISRSGPGVGPRPGAPPTWVVQAAAWRYVECSLKVEAVGAGTTGTTAPYALACWPAAWSKRSTPLRLGHYDPTH